MSEESPFKPGARVAIRIGDRYTAYGYREDFVEKTHKTGRFTLKSNPKQQWSPHQPSGIGPHWTAWETGDHGWNGGGYLRIWNDVNNAEITEAIRAHRRFHKYTKLRQELDRQPFSELVTDEVLDQLQIVVLAVKPIPKEKP